MLIQLGPLATMRGSALAHGCDRGGRVVLPLARAAAVSTRLKVRGRRVGAHAAQQLDHLCEVRAGGTAGR